MIDQRLVLTAAVVLAVLAIALVRGSADRAPLDPAASSPSTPSAREGRTVPTAPTTAPASTAAARLDELVAAARPHPVAGVNDDHHHATHLEPEDVAAAVVVALWSWRYDDTPSRLNDDLAGLATTELIAARQPTPAERSRRESAGEVAWAVVTRVGLHRDQPHTVAVDLEHHLVDALNPERVTPLRVAVSLTRDPAGWMAATLTESP